MSTGFYYEPLDLVTDSIVYFNKLVNDIADAKVRLYLDKIHQLTASAITAGKIPAKMFKQAQTLLFNNTTK